MNNAFKILSILVPLAAIVFCTMLFWGKYMHKQDEIKPQTFSIEIKSQMLNASDSLDTNTLQLQEMLTELKRQEDVIEQKFQLLLEAKENESNTIELLSIIVAVLLAVAGFYGFKTFSDIEEKAERVARRKVEDDLPEMANKQITMEIRQHLNNVLDEQAIDEIKRSIKASLIADFLTDLESRVAVLEKKEVIADEFESTNKSEIETDNHTKLDSDEQKELQEVEEMLAKPSIAKKKKGAKKDA